MRGEVLADGLVEEGDTVTFLLSERPKPRRLSEAVVRHKKEISGPGKPIPARATQIGQNLFRVYIDNEVSLEIRLENGEGNSKEWRGTIYDVHGTMIFNQYIECITSRY